jgi:hypothetical protein
LFLISSQAQAPTSGLIACYNFNVDANDEVNSFNGTLMGGASTITYLNIGGNAVDALSIPGTILNNVTEYTIAHKIMFANFNVNNQSSSNVIFSGASSTNDNLMNFAYAKDQLPGGSVILQNTIFYIHDNVRYEFNNIDLTAGIWYHFTLIRGANNLKFYLDGVEQIPVGGLSVPSLNLTLDPSGFIFGQDQDVLAGGFQDFQCLNGSLDDLLIYNRELTDQEVLDVYNSDHSTLGIDGTQSTPLISISPNPVQNVLHVTNNDYANPITKIEVVDMKGERLSLSNDPIDNVNVSSLSSGSYFALITTRSGLTIREKFIKE